jgi:pimeloyl-ACP methyl ester carboxylesterase
MNCSVGYKDGNVLAYADYGDVNGFPILIQHGLIASIRDGDLFQRLSDLGTHLICIARPGYGASSPYRMAAIAEWAEIVAVLVAHLKLSQFDVFGISSGAPYSYALGCAFPAHVRNIFILSGIPALYDEAVRAAWPYPMTNNARLAELEELARNLFFSNVTADDLHKNDIADSTMNNGFGVAQDLGLRCADWGFRLSEVTEPVYMQHSQFDAAVPVTTAKLTAGLLPQCRLVIRETDAHFSQELLNEFITTVMSRHYQD